MKWKFQYHVFVAFLLFAIMTHYVSSKSQQNGRRPAPKSMQELDMRTKDCEKEKLLLQNNMDKISRAYNDIRLGQQHIFEEVRNKTLHKLYTLQNTNFTMLMQNGTATNNFTDLLSLNNNSISMPNMDGLTLLMEQMPNVDFSKIMPEINVNFTDGMPDLSNLNMTQSIENGGSLNMTELLEPVINMTITQLFGPVKEFDWQSLYSEDCKNVDTFSVKNMTAMETLEWVKNSKGSTKTLRMLNDDRTGLSSEGIKSLIKGMVDSTDNEREMGKRFKSSIGAFSETYFKRKGGYSSMTMQDVEELGATFFLEMIPPNSYSRMPDDVFDAVLESFNEVTKEMLELMGELDNTKNPMLNTSLISMMNRDQSRLKALCRAAFTRYKHLDTLSVTDMNKLRYLLPCAEARECKKIQKSWVQANIDLLNNMPMFCNSVDKVMDLKALSMFPSRRVCGQYIVEKALSGGNILLSNPGDLPRIANFLDCVPASYIKTAINEGGCNFTKEVLKMALKRSLQVKQYDIKNCIEVPQNFSGLSCSALSSKLGPYISEMKMSFYNGIPKDILCAEECIALFKSEDIPNKLKKKVTQKCFADKNVPLNSADVDKLGSMVMDLPLAKFEDVTAEDLERNIENIKKDMKKGNMKQRRRKQAAMKKFAEKMIKAKKISAIRDSKEIMRELSTKDLKASITDIEADLGVDDSDAQLALTDSQNKWVMKELKKTKRPSNYTADDIREKKSLVKGFLKSDIKEMAKAQSESNDPHGIEMAQALCEQQNWPLVPLKAINRDLIVGGLKALNDTAPFSFLSTFDVADFDCQCMMHFKKEELALMSTEVCSAVCSKIGSCDRFRCTNPNHRRKVMQACMDCMDLTSLQLTESDLSSLGVNLLSELATSEVQSKLTGEVLSLKIYEFKGMCMDKEFRIAITNLLDTHFGSNGSALDEATLRLLGSAIMFFPQVMQQEMDKAVISSIASDIMMELKPTEDTAIELKKCCERWMSAEDSVDLKELTHNLMITIKDSILWKIQESRRKRSTENLICDYIKLLGDSIITLTNEEINGITAEEFTECLPDIGQLSTWSDSQKINLLEKAVNSLNTSVCNMTAEQVVQLGSISQAISMEGLACLPLTDSDVVSTLGGLTGWNSAKLATLAEDYMVKNSITSLSSNSLSLATLGELVCGFTPVTISTINVAVVAVSGIQLGRLEDCSVNQYTALKGLIEDPSAYGQIGNWSAADVTELKNVLVGLTTDDIKELSINALEGINAEVIAKLPGPVFAASTDEQLGSLTSVQLASVTDAQKQLMSQAQITLVDSIVNGDTSGNNNSGNDDKTPESKAGTVVSAVAWIVSLAVILILLEP